MIEITVNPTNNSTSEISRDFIAKGGEPIVATLVWTDDDGVEQTVADGTDPTASRAVYQFDMLAASIQSIRGYANLGHASHQQPTAAATKAADWSYDANNVKQIVADSPTAGQAIRLYFRKVARFARCSAHDLAGRYGCSGSGLRRNHERWRQWRLCLWLTGRTLDLGDGERLDHMRSVTG